jgi:AcrR family transcriptional regulator
MLLQSVCSQRTATVNGMTAASPERIAPTYRQEQALATRARIQAAARRLFARDGYRMTTMAAIAQAAGVAPRTVYTAFGAKREILSAICETWLEEAHAREIVAAAIAEPSPAATVAHAAHFLRSLFETGYDVVVLFDAAQAEDPETRAMLRAKLDGRNHVQNLIVASLGDNLTTPLGTAQAVYRALAATGIYQELVVESGWSIDQYEQWVADQLSLQLLGKKRRRN